MLGSLTNTHRRNAKMAAGKLFFCQPSAIFNYKIKKKNYKKNALTQARLVIIPEMKLYVHKKSGYDSRDDVMFTQKLRL